jgi:transforming growth factor-beta-induced protein
MLVDLLGKRTMTLVALVAALSLAACSSDDDGGDNGGGGDDAGVTDMGGGEADASGGDDMGGGDDDMGGGGDDMGGGDDDAASGPKTIVEIVLGTPRFSTLAQAAGASDTIPATLSGEGPFTVFAPNDDAFAKIPKEDLDAVLGDKQVLDLLLSYHGVAGKVMAADVKPGVVDMLPGLPALIRVEGDDVFINDAKIVMKDIEASNGVIHEIDTVIVPPGDVIEEAEDAEDFTTLLAALDAADLTEALEGDGPFTVFAPNDAAFAKIPKEQLDLWLAEGNKDILQRVLKYHVVPARVLAADVAPGEVETLDGTKLTISVEGGEVMVDGAKVIATDVLTSNGVIHVIDSVITPPLNVVETARATPGFGTLVAAVTAADLGETLSGEGPFTVFAPTDTAFEGLPKETLDNLLKPENKLVLQSILKYHVVAGKVMKDQVAAGEVETLDDGNKFTVAIDGDVMVDDAKVVAPDVEASNGVIHVIDKVIVPPFDLVETAMFNTDFNTLVAAVKAAELVDTLRGAGPFTVFAPNDAAFAKIDEATLADLLKPENKTTLANILLYHVVAGQKVDAQTAGTLVGSAVETAHPDKLSFTVVDNGGLGLEGGDGTSAKIIATDVDGTNGTIHVLDSVIMPPTPK